jgi:hypothetical protein
VAAHHVKPAVVIMSLGVTGGTWSRALEQATLGLIRDHGIPVVVASGAPETVGAASVAALLAWLLRA